LYTIFFCSYFFLFVATRHEMTQDIHNIWPTRHAPPFDKKILCVFLLDYIYISKMTWNMHSIGHALTRHALPFDKKNNFFPPQRFLFFFLTKRRDIQWDKWFHFDKFFFSTPQRFFSPSTIFGSAFWKDDETYDDTRDVLYIYIYSVETFDETWEHIYIRKDIRWHKWCTSDALNCDNETQDDETWEHIYIWWDMGTYIYTKRHTMTQMMHKWCTLLWLWDRRCTSFRFETEMNSSVSFQRNVVKET